MMHARWLAPWSLLLAVPSPISHAFAREAAPAPQRLLQIDGARNVRDAGGYRTADGLFVKWRHLYRSGSLGRLTPEGRKQLQGLGIRAIVDLRTTQERARDGNDWLAHADLGYWTRDYGQSQADMSAYFADPAHRTPDAIRQMMVGAYRRLPFEQAPAYKVLFERLAAGGTGAVVVNCTAGKDRTGIATALVLTALGVPYATVRQDFLLTNQVIDTAELQAALSGPVAALPHDAALPLLTVEGEYLDAAFATMRARDGSIEGYLQKELGIGPAAIAAMRQWMLTDG